MRGAYSRSKGLPRIAVAFKTAGEGGKAGKDDVIDAEFEVKK